MEVVVGSDGVARCEWASSADIMAPYHDTEWGFPVADDRHLFEKLCLESFQSGLAWITILRKRDAFRQVFYDFDPMQVAAMDEADILRLLDDSRIVRHRRKIESAINNAKRTLELQEEQSLASFVWQFEPSEPPGLATETKESRALAKELKTRGFTWVGPTNIHAFMQSMGLVNDHLVGCEYHEAATVARAAFEVPLV